MEREYLEFLFSKEIERIIDDGKDVIIYPFGTQGLLFKNILNNKYGINEQVIIDNKMCKYNKKVKSIEELEKIDCSNSMVVITSDNWEYFDEIRENIRKYIPEENIVDVFNLVDMNVDRRVETLRLCANIINQNKLKGSVAELGVYEGDFAKYINKFFPSKNLFLFDTFNGFKEEKLWSITDEKWKDFMNIHQNDFSVLGNVDSVLSKMKYPENCIIKKGFFPDTANDIEDTFCFVSLDVDIYQTTKDGLEFFWNKMESRGIIFIHDYNYSWCKGVKKAVDEFCDKQDIGIICLPDVCGSVALIKN